MSEQSTILRAETLHQAINTVIHDVRIPVKLRAALATCQDDWVGPHNRENDIVRAEPSETTRQAETLRQSHAEASESNCSGRATSECRSLNCLWATIEEEIWIRMVHNDDTLDWSVVINGRRHDHVTSEIMEALVECALIVGQASLTRILSRRSQ